MAGYDIEDLEVENIDVSDEFIDDQYDEEDDDQYEVVGEFGPYNIEDAEEKWKDKEFEELVSEMAYLVASGKKYLFFSKTKRVVNGQEIDLLSQYIQDKFPEELVKANEIIARENSIITEATSVADATKAEADSYRVSVKANADALYNETINKAKAEAAAIIAAAQAQANDMVQEHSITRMARDEAERIRIETDKQTQEMISRTTAECESLMEKARGYAVAIVQSAYAFIKKNLINYQNVAANNLDTVTKVFAQFEGDYAVQVKNLGLATEEE